MFDKIADYFLQPQNGVLGVIVVILILIVVWQQKRLDKKDALVADLQEKRKIDVDTYTKNYTDMAKEAVGTQKDSTNAINLLQRSVDSLTAGFQSFMNGKGK